MFSFMFDFISNFMFNCFSRTLLLVAAIDQMDKIHSKIHGKICR